MGAGKLRVQIAALAVALLGSWGAVSAGAAQTASAGIDETLQNITTLKRPGRVGYATIWDGNKFIQCRRLAAGALRCEAAGTTMQPTLKAVLTPERIRRLAALGWTLNSSFGNYVQDFAADMPTAGIADHIFKTLKDGYGADVSQLEWKTAWVADTPCPPRSGPSQNLAGSVNDAPSMQFVVVRTCSYTPKPAETKSATNVEELVAIYGQQTAAEIQRLRLNGDRKVWIIFDAGIGYIQCAPETPSLAIYCEAQSADSWPALAAILTPERVSKLKTAGYADPGRAPNYSRSYPIATFNDAAIAREVLRILHEVYGYTGSAKLKFLTEQR